MAARADELPTAFVERPLTLPAVTIDPWVGAGYTHGDGTIFAPTSTTAISAGVAAGLADDLEIDVALPITVDPSVRYGRADLAATFRAVRGNVEAGVWVEVVLPAQGTFGSATAIGVPVRVHLGRVLRIATAVEAWELFASVHGATVIAVPVAIDLQIARPLFVGVAATVDVGVDDRGLGLLVPLGFHVGVTLPRASGPVADLVARFGFPSVYGANGQASSRAWWTASLTAAVYFQL